MRQFALFLAFYAAQIVAKCLLAVTKSRIVLFFYCFLILFVDVFE